MWWKYRKVYSGRRCTHSPLWFHTKALRALGVHLTLLTPIAGNRAKDGAINEPRKQGRVQCKPDLQGWRAQFVDLKRRIAMRSLILFPLPHSQQSSRHQSPLHRGQDEPWTCHHIWRAATYVKKWLRERERERDGGKAMRTLLYLRRQALDKQRPFLPFVACRATAP